VTSGVAEVVINEIHYNPVDRGFEAGSLREFVELYNPGPGTVDLSGYAFTKGISYTFLQGTALGADAYLMLARVPTHKTWRNRGFAVLGPYGGKLSDAGDELVLRRPDGTKADSVKYDDSLPWPRAADGYGSTLERISWDLHSNDFHSWRASLEEEGTPGRVNSVAGVASRPVITAIEVEPKHPTSVDAVTVRVGFDAPTEIVSSKLRWELAGKGLGVSSDHMQKVAETPGSATYEATIPPAGSETLIRFNVEVQLSSGRTLRLPHEAEPRPFESCFVYDGEVVSLLPVLWILHPTTTGLPVQPRKVSGVVTLLPGQTKPEVFDGARVMPSRNGHKIKFLKGEEFRGDRTLNVVPEEPPWGTKAGASAPFIEHLGFWFYCEMGVLSPRAEFFRVVTLPVSSRTSQTQQLVIQQVNERFLEMNGRDPHADLYKLERFNPNWEKHTNKEEGTASVEALIAAISTRDPVKRREAMERNLVLDEFVAYSVASVLTSNWDGFWQNNWMYLDPAPGGRWEIIPWDLDWLWGPTSDGTMYARMPTTFPIDGQATGAPQASRPPGPITAILHKDEAFHEQYLMSLRFELQHSFSETGLYAKIDEMEGLLLEDLGLLEQQVGEGRLDRRTHIRESYAAVKSFIRQRRTYLDRVLPASVTAWTVY
jgi:hypothetical protein